MSKLNSDFLPQYVSGIPVHSYPKKEVLEYMDYCIKQDRKKRHICITNTESMFYARKTPRFLGYVKTAAFSFCDGIGSVIAGKFQGQKIKRLNGPDLLLACCDYGQQKEWRHFFCGGKEGVANILAKKLKTTYPNLIVAGTYCPPFREMNTSEISDMIAKINESKADIIWVGLGLLKQEYWIADHKEKLNIPWSVGVGAAFDFYAGTVKRAPELMRKIGFEWLFRLVLEPRMFKRNVNSYNFMFRAIGDGIVNSNKNKNT